MPARLELRAHSSTPREGLASRRETARWGLGWTLGRRGALSAAAVACSALCAAGCGEIHARMTVGRQRPVTVALDGPPSALYAPLYEARAARDFAAGALAVKIVSAADGDALAALESGRAAIAVTSEPELLAARDAGHRLVAVGALTSQPLDAIISLAHTPVGAAGQLAGRTIAMTGTPLARAQLASVLAAAHVPARRVRTVTVPAASLGASLTRRHAAGAALGGPWPLELAVLDNAGQRARALALPQAGVPSYSGLVLAVRVGEAHYDGPLLRAFLQSLSRGEAVVAANPAAAAATMARVGAHNASYERAVLALTMPISAAPTAAEPFGYQNPQLWQSFGAWMQAHGLLRNAPNAEFAITDEFLPGQGEAVVTSN